MRPVIRELNECILIVVATRDRDYMCRSYWKMMKKKKTTENNNNHNIRAGHDIWWYWWWDLYVFNVRTGYRVYNIVQSIAIYIMLFMFFFSFGGEVVNVLLYYITSVYINSVPRVEKKYFCILLKELYILCVQCYTWYIIIIMFINRFVSCIIFKVYCVYYISMDV